MSHDDAATEKRKPYAAPTLVEYGSVAKLTETKAGSNLDGKSGMVMQQKCL